MKRVVNNTYPTGRQRQLNKQVRVKLQLSAQAMGVVDKCLFVVNGRMDERRLGWAASEEP